MGETARAAEDGLSANAENGRISMARGRLITNEITRDKKINELSNDTSRLAFTWLITFADVEGRTYGDPALVRSMLFPRRTDITIEQMAGYLQEWHNARLIIWYETDGDWFVYFPHFAKHQPKLQKDREAPSNIPGPLLIPNITPEQLQSNSRVTPEQLNVKLREVKLREVEVNDDSPQLFSQMSAAFVTETKIPELTGGVERWVEAINQMVKAGVTVDDMVT